MVVSRVVPAALAVLALEAGAILAPRSSPAPRTQPPPALAFSPAPLLEFLSTGPHSSVMCSQWIRTAPLRTGKASGAVLLMMGDSRRPSSKMGFGGKAGKAKGGKSLSHSKKAGLQFPVGDVAKVRPEILHAGEQLLGRTCHSPSPNQRHGLKRWLRVKPPPVAICVSPTAQRNSPSPAKGLRDC